MQPSVHPSPLPFTFNSAVYAQRSFGARGLFGDTKQCPFHFSPVPCPRQNDHPTSSAGGAALSAISISESIVPLCCCYLRQCHFSFLLSSSSFYSIPRFSNPPHHPPFIFRALSWLSLPKPSGLIVWSRGIKSASWNEICGFLSATIFQCFHSLLCLLSPPTSHTHPCWLFHSCFLTFCGLPQAANPNQVSFPFIPMLCFLLHLTSSWI